VLVLYWPRLILSCDLLYLPKFIYGLFKVICIKGHQNILLYGVFDDIFGAWINKNIRITLIIVLVLYWPRLIFSCDLLYLPKFIYGLFKVICIKEHQNILLYGVLDDILGAWINKNIRITLIIVLVLYWPRLIFSCDLLYLPKFIYGLFKVICIKGHQNILLYGVLDDILGAWINKNIRLYYSGYMTGKHYYTILDNDISNTWCFNFITDINPWKSISYRCTERYFMGLNSLQPWSIVVFCIVL
jgi:hypothetical protein